MRYDTIEQMEILVILWVAVMPQISEVHSTSKHKACSVRLQPKATPLPGPVRDRVAASEVRRTNG